MSHVDEGRLHAFLDGALSAADPADAERVELHLAACADCRALMEDAARLRDEASALLGSAQPRAFVMPSFDAIRARSATVAPAQRVRPSILRMPFNDFAWAAMVMLAIGLGWMLNDTVGPDDRRVLVPGVTLRNEAATESSGVASLDFAIEPAAPDAEEAAPAPVAADDRLALEPRGEAGSAVSGAGAERAAEYDVVPEAAPAPALAYDAVRESEAIEELRVETQSARRSQAPVTAAPAPPPPSLAQAAPASAAAEEGRAAAGADAAGAPADADAGWRRITVSEAERLTDGKLVRLAGARITSSAARGSGTELEVQTVQLTDRGESIKVVQRRTPLLEARRREALESQAEMPANATVTAGLTVRVEEWTVTISGAVPPDRLRELAARLS